MANIFNETIELHEVSSDPSTPQSGVQKLFAKTDNQLYMRDSSGNLYNLSFTIHVDETAPGNTELLWLDTTYEYAGPTGGYTIETTAVSTNLDTQTHATYLRSTSATAITITITDTTNTNLQEGQYITIEQAGAGTVTIATSGSQTANGDPGTAGQYKLVQALKVAANTWTIIGGVA